MTELIEDIIEAFPEFLTDEPVNGGDLVEFIGGIISRYEQLRPRPSKASCPDCGNRAAADDIGTVCQTCGRGVIR